MESFCYGNDDSHGGNGPDKPHAQAKLLSLTEKCPVCSDQAAKHVHYGAMTCFSCRAFFRRSIQNKTADAYACRRTQSCDITPKTRKNCQFCRFQRCLDVGMKRNSVLSQEERNHRFRKTRDKKVSESNNDSLSAPVFSSEGRSPNPAAASILSPEAAALFSPEVKSAIVRTDVKSPITASLSNQLKGVSLTKAEESVISRIPLSAENSMQHNLTTIINSSRSSAIQSQRNSVISNGRTFHAAASAAAAAAAVAATQHNDIKLQLPTVNGDINDVNGHYKTVISGGNSVKQSPNYSLLNGMHSLHNGGGLSTTPNGVIHSSLKIKEEPNLSVCLSSYSNSQDDCSDLSPISPEDALRVVENVPYDDISVLLQETDHTFLQESSSGESNLTSDRFSDRRSPYDTYPTYQSHTVDSSATSTDLEDLEDLEQFYAGYDISSCDTLTQFEEEYIRILVRDHNERYVSVNFGDELIKEMVMVSMFNYTLKSTSALAAYKLSIERMTKVAEGLEPFQKLSQNDKRSLLKENSDLLINVRAAIFFNARNKGIDQVLVSLGIEDSDKFKNMFSSLLEDGHSVSMKHINYTKFNTLQQSENKETENRYDIALAKVGNLLVGDDNVVVLLTIIILFSSDFCSLEDRVFVEATQAEFICLLRKYFNSKSNSRTMSIVKFAKTLEAVSLVREMAEIKKSRKVNEEVQRQMINAQAS